MSLTFPTISPHLLPCPARVIDPLPCCQLIDVLPALLLTDDPLPCLALLSCQVIGLAEFRQSLHKYLIDKMAVVAPNLSALIGEVVGARLISHAGSLTNLAKYPASTVQILGAEKALFRWVGDLRAGAGQGEAGWQACMLCAPKPMPMGPT